MFKPQPSNPSDLPCLWSWRRHQMETFSALLVICAGNSPMFSLIRAWTNGWVYNLEAGDLRRHRVYYDISVMVILIFVMIFARLVVWRHHYFLIPLALAAWWGFVCTMGLMACGQNCPCVSISTWAMTTISTSTFLFSIWFICDYLSSIFQR